MQTYNIVTGPTHIGDVFYEFRAEVSGYKEHLVTRVAATQASAQMTGYLERAAKAAFDYAVSSPATNPLTTCHDSLATRF